MVSVVNISSKNLKYIIKMLEIKNVKLVISSFSWKTNGRGERETDSLKY